MKISGFIFFSVIFLINGCSEIDNKTNPIAKIEVFPAFGDTSTVFNLSGSKSINYGDIQLGLTYSWFIDDSMILEPTESSQAHAATRFRTVGKHRIQLRVQNCFGAQDTATTQVFVGWFRKDSFCFDPRDNRKYRIVLVNSVWWFAENLKYGSILNNNEVPSNNGIVERYVRFPKLIDQDGYYLPEEVHLYSSNPDSCICPPGWSLPDYSTYISMANSYLWFNNNHEFFISGGITGINLDNVGYFNSDSAKYNYSSYSYWWGKEIVQANYPKVTYSILILAEAMLFFRRPYDQEGYFPERALFQQIKFALPVRCIKKE